MSFLKRLMFFGYVAWKRMCWWFATLVAEEKDAEPVFIWKDFWFLSWHVFFWGGGRWFVAHFKKVRPLERELSHGAEEHYRRFGELASRDSQARPLQDRIIRPTHYRLSKEAAQELCAFYAHLMDIAPWQYGMEKRSRARRGLGYSFLLSLVAFVASCVYTGTDPHLSAWLTLITLFATAGTLAGWTASCALYRLASAAERAHQKEEKAEENTKRP